MLAKCIVPILLAVAAKVAAQGQLAFVPVGDLLAPHQLTEPYLGEIPLQGGRWILGEEAWLSCEEDWSVLAASTAGYFDREPLQGLLAILLDRSADELQVITGDLLVIPGPAEGLVSAALQELRQRLPAAVKFELELRRHDHQGELVLLRRTVDCVSGRLQVISELTQSMALGGFEVEVAEGAVIANPQMLPRQHGAMVVLRPYLSPSAGELLVEILVRIAEPIDEEVIELGHPGFGAIDRLSRRVGEMAGLLRCSSGATTERHWSGPLGTRYSLQLRPRWSQRRALSPGGHELEYAVDFPQLAGFRTLSVRPEGLEGPLEQRGLCEAVQLEFAGMAPLLAIEPLEDGGVLVALDEAARSMRHLVAAHLAAAPAGPHIELSFFDVPAGGQAEAASARKIGGMTADLVVGSWYCATAYRDRSVLADWEVEIAQSARIPTPITRRVHDGLFVNMRWQRGKLEIDGEYSRRREDDSQELPLNVAMAVVATSKSPKNGRLVDDHVDATFLPQDRVRIEKPIVHRAPFAALLDVQADAVVAVRQSTGLFGSDRELLITARRGR